jgi:hypothetical protein
MPGGALAWALLPRNVMKNLFRNSGWIFVGAACASLAIPGYAQVTAYQNFANPTPSYYSFAGTTAVGNEISLSTGGGSLNSFSFDYYGAASGSAWAGSSVQYMVTLYANDGTLLHATDPTTAQPSTVLGQTPWETLTLPSTLSGGTTFAQATVAASDFTQQALKALPGELTWTVQVQGLGAGDKAGLYFFGNGTTGPTIGGATTFNDYWVNTASGAPGSWDIQSSSLTSSSLYGVQLTVIPEPTTLALSIFGGLGFLVMARRFRK